MPCPPCPSTDCAQSGGQVFLSRDAMEAESIPEGCLALCLGCQSVEWSLPPMEVFQILREEHTRRLRLFAEIKVNRKLELCFYEAPAALIALTRMESPDSPLFKDGKFNLGRSLRKSGTLIKSSFALSAYGLSVSGTPRATRSTFPDSSSTKTSPEKAKDDTTLSLHTSSRSLSDGVSGGSFSHLGWARTDTCTFSMSGTVTVLFIYAHFGTDIRHEEYAGPRSLR